MLWASNIMHLKPRQAVLSSIRCFLGRSTSRIKYKDFSKFHFKIKQLTHSSNVANLCTHLFGIQIHTVFLLVWLTVPFSKWSVSRNWKPFLKSRFRYTSPCVVYDNKKMHCLSPKIDIPVAWRNPDNPEPIPLDYGFIMDDVKRVQVICRVIPRLTICC